MPISIITPVYNRQNLFVETVASVLRQTSSEWEYLIIDDGSTDGVLQLAMDYAKKDDRVKVIQRNRQPKGANTCKNIGWASAKYPYVMFLDSDDLLDRKAITERMSFIDRNPGNELYIFPYAEFNTNPEELVFDQELYFGKDAVESFIYASTPWSASTGPVWHKDALKKLNGFDENLHAHRDLDFCFRAMLAGIKKVKSTDFPTIFYRNAETVKSEEVVFSELAGEEYCRDKMTNLLITSNRLTDIAKVLLEKRYLDISLEWLRIGQFSKGLLCWKKVRTYQLVHPIRYTIIYTLLKLRILIKPLEKVSGIKKLTRAVYKVLNT